MTKFEHYLSGNVFGIKYIFETVNDGLPRHTHDATTAHNVCVMRGHVKVMFDDHTMYLNAGTVFDFDGGLPHSIQAVTAGACILNMFLSGQPADYRLLPPEELRGEFDVRHFVSRS